MFGGDIKPGMNARGWLNYHKMHRNLYVLNVKTQQAIYTHYALSSFTKALSEVLIPYFSVEETDFRESMSGCSN